MIEFVILKWYCLILSLWNFTGELGWMRGNPWLLAGAKILEYKNFRLTIFHVQVVKFVVGLHYEFV